ncbi:MAG: 2-keto-4-pentenoate hydratase [Phenylobacterium sp.]
MADRAETLALELAARHARRDIFTSIFDDGETPDVPLAYRVQEHFVAGLGGTAVGFKVGLTTERMQKMCGVNEPISGVVLASRVLRSPSSAQAGDYVRLGLESEMAVRIAPGAGRPGLALQDLPLHHLIDQVCAAFELVEDSGADYAKLSAASIIADNSWNAGLVLGPPIPVGGLAHLPGRRGVLKLNGEPVNEGRSDEVLGDPLNAVHWLASHLRRRGQALKPGQWVSTGAIVPTRFAAPGEAYRFEIDGLPPVELQVS